MYIKLVTYLIPFTSLNFSYGNTESQNGLIICANKNSARENPRAPIGRFSLGVLPDWSVHVYPIFKLTFAVV